MGSGKSPTVSVIILAWGSNKDIGLLIEMAVRSVVDTVRCSYEIIVVSNSEDRTFRERVQIFKEVDRWCINSHNTGVARGWNMGAQLALGKYICFINQDVVVGPRCVDTLVNVLDADPKIGIAGPEGAFWKVTLLDATHNSSVDINEGIVECDAVSGFLFVQRSDIYDLVGGFDRSYTPCLFEEMDMSFQVRRHGFRCVVVGGLEYEHPWGVSGGNSWRRLSYLGMNERIHTIRERNRKRFVTRWGRKLSLMMGEKASESASCTSSASENILAHYIGGRLKTILNDLFHLVKFIFGR